MRCAHLSVFCSQNTLFSTGLGWGCVFPERYVCWGQLVGHMAISLLAYLGLHLWSSSKPRWLLSVGVSLLWYCAVVSESNITKSTIFEPQVCASFGRLPRCCWLRIGTDSDPSLSGTQISSKSRCQPEVGFCIIWPISLLITWNCDFAFLFFSNRRSHNHDKRSPMGSEGSIVASSTFWGKTDGDAAAERCFCTLSGANPLKNPILTN